ncbi:hypothetical protein H9P43_005199 [Blastocladiella emersonii ATCC 22665]|nr:hypothetical protein H9P43_005194 [Blastocladiella emersonii ATCC 22665]KAI9179867.1 hypothetical protein H9P43_005199 [Blastocladiella emersonii ATCC 22665]
MESDLALELLEAIVAHLAHSPRDLGQARAVSRRWLAASQSVRSLVLHCRQSQTPLPDILEQYPNLRSLALRLAPGGTFANGAPRNKSDRVDALQSAAAQFRGHAKLERLESDSELALPGALQCPNLVSLKASTVFTFDALLDGSGNGVEAPSGNVLVHSARNLATLIEGLPKLRLLHMVRPIFWRRTARPVVAEAELAQAAEGEDPVLPPLGPRITPAQPVSSLESLCIELIPAWALINLLGYIGRGHLPHLREFALMVDLHLPRDTFHLLAAGCPKLASLDIAQARFAPDHLAALALFGGSLTKLRLNTVECYVPRSPHVAGGDSPSVHNWLLPMLAKWLPQLTSLELAQCEYLETPGQPWTLDAHPAANRTLEKLTLLHPDPRHACSTDLVAQLFPNLRALSLYTDYEHAVDQVAALAQLPHLRDLELRYQSPPRGGSAVSATIANPSTTVPVLPLTTTSLHLWLPPVQGWVVSRAIAPLSNSLTRLQLSYPSAGLAAEFEAAAPTLSLPVLRELDVKLIGAQSGETAQRLVRAVCRNPTSLQRLHVSALNHVPAPLEVETIQVIGASAPLLRTFEVVGLAVDGAAFHALARQWARSLRVLEVCGTGVVFLDAMVDVALQRLLGACTRLRALTLAVEEISDDVVAPEPVEQVHPMYHSANDSAIDLTSASSSDDDVPELADSDGSSPPPAILSRRARADSGSGIGRIHMAHERGAVLSKYAKRLMSEFRGLEDVVVETKAACRFLGRISSLVE